MVFPAPWYCCLNIHFVCQVTCKDIELTLVPSVITIHRVTNIYVSDMTVPRTLVINSLPFSLCL